MFVFFCIVLDHIDWNQHQFALLVEKFANVSLTIYCFLNILLSYFHSYS